MIGAPAGFRYLPLSIFALAWACASALAGPFISSVLPTAGAPGTPVVIQGSGFFGVEAVWFNTTRAQYTVTSSGRITTTVPADATTGPITVDTASGSATTTGDFVVAPRILAVAPASAGRGEPVVIYGANFIEGNTTVKFNGLAALTEVVATTQLSVIVPAQATTGPITVSTLSTLPAASTTADFVVIGTGPVVSGFSPASGTTGDQVVISGVHMDAVREVRFNGKSAVFQVTAATQIIATVPTGATTGPLSLVWAGGTVFTTTHFTVTQGSPFLDSFQPARGLVGATVTVIGRNLGTVTSVRFGAVATSFSIQADTQLQAIVPTGAITAPIVISSASQSVTSSVPFTVISAPFLTRFTPQAASRGTDVLIEGENLGIVSGVLFGTAPALFEIVSDTQIHAQVPLAATNGPITLQSTNGNTISTQSFQVLAGTPLIESFTPAYGQPGQQVLIQGTAFTGATNVSFGGASAAFEVTSDTQILTTAPQNGVSGLISVANGSAIGFSTNAFYYMPTAILANPTHGVPGDAIIILGFQFTNVTAVKFNGTTASFHADSLNQITATVPEDSESGFVTVTTPGGTAVVADTFTLDPSIVRFSPLGGPPGTVVTIVGTGLSQASAVLFGGIRATTFTVQSSTRILATVPNNAQPGPISVVTPSKTVVSSRSFAPSASADLAITATSKAWEAIPNDAFPVFVTVTNQGPSAASGIVVTSTFPAGVSSLDRANASQGSVALGTRVAIWQVGSLTAGSVATCSIFAQADAQGTYTNIVTASSSAPDSNQTDNTAFAVVVVSSPYGRNLVRNGDAESDPGSTDGATRPAPTGWVVTGAPGIVRYGAGSDYPGPASLGPPIRGSNFLAGGLVAASSTASQTRTLSTIATDIDSGTVTYDSSAYLGGTVDADDNASFKLLFYDATAKLLGSATAGPVLAVDRTNTTALLLRSNSGVVPKRTRSVEMRLEFVRASGTGLDRACADNLAFVLQRAPIPQLRAEYVNGSVLVSWPTNQPGFLLQQTFALPSISAGWAGVGLSPGVVGDRFVITNSAPSGQRYFRLLRQ